jgi:uncharacterized protein YidB (DUF937 family)
MGALDSLMKDFDDDLDRLKSKFEASGLGKKIESWIGKGENEQISADEVKQALGQDEVDRVAQQAGVDAGQAADELARKLPAAVDEATPDGRIPSLDEVKQRLSSLLGRT